MLEQVAIRVLHRSSPAHHLSLHNSWYPNSYESRKESVALPISFRPAPRERDASKSIRRHQAFALVPVTGLLCIDSQACEWPGPRSGCACTNGYVHYSCGTVYIRAKVGWCNLKDFNPC